MIVITKYQNRKLYNRETGAYVGLKDILAMNMGSFKVVEKETNKDITVDTLLSGVANSNSEPETKIQAMKHCINLLSQ